MISYCVAVYRPRYARLLVEDLCRKTRVPYEVLLWLNCDDAAFEAFVAEAVAGGAPVRIVGRSPQNLGMQVYESLFRAARHPMFVQIDDDVVSVCHGIAERAGQVFRAHPEVRQIVADVWQDEYTTGARPEMNHYRLVDPDHGLYEGPIDGWFSIYHRSVLGLLPPLGGQRYLPLGGLVCNGLRARGLRGVLCTRLKVFHVIGPQYCAHFGTLHSEIAKYRELGRGDIVAWYEEAAARLPPRDELARRVSAIRNHLDAWQA